MAVRQPDTAPPASRPARPGRFWSRLHFLIRFLGLTGALAGCAGLVLAGVTGQLVQLNSLPAVRDAAQAMVEGRQIELGFYLILIGGAAALFALLIEALVVLVWTAGRRSIFGLNAVVQAGLAAALLIGANVVSFQHYRRIDCTRDRLFTLPADVQRDLAQLGPESQTTIIVYQRHKTFGALSDRPPDDYDSAAERKVVERVKDLAELFRAAGSQIKVEVLDVQARDYKQRLHEVTDEAVQRSSEQQTADEQQALAELGASTVGVLAAAGGQGPLLTASVLPPGKAEERLRQQRARAAEALRQAIESTAENTLFFYAQGKNHKPYLQRLSFNDVYLLDKMAAQEDRGGRGNLVLLSQGPEPFARRILNIEEKKPRIGIAVIHKVLSTAGANDWGLQGLRKALEARGFQVEDIVLKKWSRFAPPAAAAYTVEESALERLEEREAVLEKLITNLRNERPLIEKSLAVWTKATEDQKTRDELTRQFGPRLRGGQVTVELARTQARILREGLEELDEAVSNYQQRLSDARAEKAKLNVPAINEQRRLSDVRAKLARQLADCDLLIVPRMTLRNAADEFENIPARLYKLDEPQVEAIKDFLKAGKPVLACLGPINEPPDDRRPAADTPDGLEALLSEGGVKFGKQTVLFDEEVESFADARASSEIGGAATEVPAVLLDWQPGAGRPPGYTPPAGANPIRESLRLLTRALGKDAEGKPRTLELRIRHPRPIYYEPPRGKEVNACATIVLQGQPLAAAACSSYFLTRQHFDADFLMTSPRSWNEDQPFPTADSIPQFQKPKRRDEEAPKSAEPAADSLDARRRGPFPIAVAVQTNLSGRPARLAVIGQGGFFTGKTLPPTQEKLMVNTVNWLLGRDDRLPRDDHPWSYPRVNDTIPPDSPTEYLWLWGTRLGLPVLFAYLGLVMLLVRRLR